MDVSGKWIASAPRISRSTGSSWRVASSALPSEISRNAFNALNAMIHASGDGLRTAAAYHGSLGYFAVKK
jgi:hypothetical protein